MTLNELITSTGVKKEHLLKVAKIPRNRFYKAIKTPYLFTMDELERIAFHLRIDKDIIIKVAINEQTARPHN